MKVKKTYRIEQEIADKLAKLAEEQGKTATDVLEGAIRVYDTEPDDSHTPDVALEALREQLQVKDRQIGELLEALRGAQALHAVDKKPGLLAEATRDGDNQDEEAMTWWCRFKMAWKEAGKGNR